MQLNNNPNFRSITPNEFIEEGTLVWTERNRHNNSSVVQGPYIVEQGWGPLWFGDASRNKSNQHNKVRLMSTHTGFVEEVTWGSFLFTTYYVMTEEKLCIDAEIK